MSRQGNGPASSLKRKAPGSLLLGFILAMAFSVWSQEPGAANLPDSLMAPGTKVVWFKKLPYYCEGPAVDKDGNLFFDQQMDNNTPYWPIWKINPKLSNDTGMVFLENSNQANGINFDKNWHMVVGQNRQLSRFDYAGNATVIATSGDPEIFGQVNDMGLASSGAMFFTDLGTNIYFTDSTGKTRTVFTGANSANGIEWVEEKSHLYLNQNGGTTRFDASRDGILINPIQIFSVNGPDGLCLDEHYNFYIASYTAGEVYAFNAQGEKLGKIAINPSGIYDSRSGKEGNTSNCAFGGPGNKTLFITGDGGVYSVQMKIAGRRMPGMHVGLFPKKSKRIKSMDPIIFTQGQSQKLTVFDSRFWELNGRLFNMDHSDRELSDRN